MPSHCNTSAAAAGPSRLSTVFGVWGKSVSTAAPSDAVEVVACIESMPPDFSLPACTPPTYAAYHEPHNTSNALDVFFGASVLQAHRPLCRATASVPPPYSSHNYGFDSTEKELGVGSVEEPLTLARMLFMYGFLAFPFWLAGIYILCSPLLPTPEWEAGKTEAEKAQLLHIHRETEKKWARRCLCAMFGLTVSVFLLSTIIMIKFGIMETL